jgi:catechol 2,3-dioxygenase-like lactoylglutathione lyase family enzyme
MMKITLTSVMVDDQARALTFYTEILGFVKKTDIPVGEYRWLTVVSPEQSGECELVLEPSTRPATQVFQKAMFDEGTPLTSFECADVQKEYERLTGLGVVFQMKPTPAGPTTVARFDDTCGNLIQIHQPVAAR